MSKKRRKPLPRIGGKAALPQPTVGGAPQLDWGTNDLPRDIAATIIGAANKMERLQPMSNQHIPPEEVNRLITENPETALEGLTKTGRVLAIPSQAEPRTAFEPLDVKARVIGDLRSGHFDNPVRGRDDIYEWTRATTHQVQTATIIDCQAVYDRWMKHSQGNDLYELRMAPPWNNGVLVYNTPVGNVWAMHMLASDIRQTVDIVDGNELRTERWTQEMIEEIMWQPSPPADHTIDWERVRWIYGVRVYVGGIGQTDSGVAKWVPTTGPIMLWRVAIYEDGEPADVNWSHLAPEIPFHKFNNALGVLTETLNMCNCVNVHVTYPTRPMSRPQRRRLDRLGVRFSELHVRPTSKSYRSKDHGVALADMEMPIHGVIGHYANYGKDGRGLLFGKLAGRFWIPPHVRGSREAGEVTQTYKMDDG